MLVVVVILVKNWWMLYMLTAKIQVALQLFWMKQGLLQLKVSGLMQEIPIGLMNFIRVRLLCNSITLVFKVVQKKILIMLQSAIKVRMVC